MGSWMQAERRCGRLVHIKELMCMGGKGMNTEQKRGP